MAQENVILDQEYVYLYERYTDNEESGAHLA